jgi:hypothetical protein
MSSFVVLNPNGSIKINLLKGNTGAIGSTGATGPAGANFSLGAWSLGAVNTSVLAATDGFVLATMVGGVGGSGSLQGFTDGSNPPTTLRAAGDCLSSSFPGGLIMPVRAGDFWKLTATTASGTPTTTVYWIPG